MADAQTIILHHYQTSPFSEKIRLALALKNLAWCGVDVPVIMPKPDVVSLTGGYRRTPFLQIGADIFCDTATILMELNRRYPMASLNLPGHEGLHKMVGMWADRIWFQCSVGVIFGALGDTVPDAFKADREKLSGRPFDTAAMASAAPMLREQWVGHLMWIEERLRGGQGAGGGVWLVNTKPGLVDVHAHMNLWFVEQNVPDFLTECLDAAPLTRDWYNRLKDFEGQTPTELSGGAAIEIARKAAPRLKPATVTGAASQAFAPGDKVAVAPDDYGRDWVEGILVHADSQQTVVQRSDARAETVHVHFPRAGYLVRAA
ncbi:MAG: glutathione S-transferase N-terminal domain-containing protein [Pseudomonadota bacterium]